MAVAEEGGHAAAGADVLLGDRVELAGADARRAPRRAAAPGSRPPAARPPASCAIWSGVLISTPRSRKPIAPCPAQLSWTSSSAAKMRLVTSSTSPMPSTSIEQVAVAVDLDQRLGLLGVDLLAPPDDVLGVVGATVGLGPLPAAAGRAPRCRRSGTTTASSSWPVNLIIPSSSSTCCERARVAVEQEAGLGVGLVDAVAHHQVGDLVGDVLPGVHVLLGLRRRGRCPRRRWRGRCHRSRSRGCRSARRRPWPGCPCRPRGGPSG